jgi:hypothetical protein
MPVDRQGVPVQVVKGCEENFLIKIDTDNFFIIFAFFAFSGPPFLYAYYI